MEDYNNLEVRDVSRLQMCVSKADTWRQNIVLRSIRLARSYTRGRDTEFHESGRVNKKKKRRARESGRDQGHIKE